MPNPNRQPNNNNWRNNTTVTSYTDTKSNKSQKTASKPKRQSFRNAVKNWFTRNEEKPSTAKNKDSVATIAPHKKSFIQSVKDWILTPAEFRKAPTQALSTTLERGNYTAQQYKKEYSTKTISQPSNSKFVQAMFSTSASPSTKIEGKSKYTQDIKRITDSFTPDTMREYAHNAAMLHTGEDTTQLSTHTLNPKSHDYIIKWGQDILMNDKAAIDWILDGDTREEQLRRQDIVNRYFGTSGREGTAFNVVNTYDPDTHSYVPQTQIRENAKMPPWVVGNAVNKAWWEYYTKYSHDVVQITANAYVQAEEAAREMGQNPYKYGKAFSDEDGSGAINSFADVLIHAAQGDSLSHKADRLRAGMSEYMSTYVINPLLNGDLKTMGLNSVYNMMETMDIAARGVRAFAAGVKPPLGGKYKSGHIFEGQDNTFWVKLDGPYDEEHVKLAQTIFLKHGGEELLSPTTVDGFAGATDVKSRDEIIADLEKAFKGSNLQGITWQEIYNALETQYFNNSELFIDSLKQGVTNVKETYTNVEADFNADTGNTFNDIVIETVLDPGLFVGGLAKGAASNSVKSAARNGVEEGFKAILRNSDDVAALANDKKVLKAINQLIRSNEGRNIIFKNMQAFDDDLDLFIKEVSKRSNIFSSEASKATFKKVANAHLMGKNRSINGMVINSTNWARNALDRKTFKAAYYMDKAIDGIDSAIIKSSFIVPWAGVKATKAGFSAFINSDTVGRAVARLNLDKAAAAHRLIDDTTGKVDVTNVEALLKKAEQGELNNKSVRKSLQFVVKEYDEVARQTNSIISSFTRGELTAEEALRLVDDAVSEITGGKYTSVKSLSGHVDRLDVKYAGDVKAAFNRVNNTMNRLENAIDRRSEKAVHGFLEDVKQAKDINDIKRLFREHSDNEFILNLRYEVIDNAQFNLRRTDIDDIVNEIQTGLFTETPLTRGTVQQGIDGVSKLAKNTINRTVNIEQFSTLINNTLGVDWKTVDELSDDLTDAQKVVVEFMKKWSKQSHITYTTQDALKIIDRFESQVHFNILLKLETPSEASALVANSMIKEFNNLRQSIKNIDVISLKDAKVVTLLHTDRMALQQEFRNNSSIQNLYGEFYSNVIEPFADSFRGSTTNDIDLMDSALSEDIAFLSKQKYGYDRTTQLINESRFLAGFSDEQLHSFLNTLAVDFKFTNEAGDINLSPGALRRRLEGTLRGQTGDSKLGKKNMISVLQSADSDTPNTMLEPYLSELADDYNKARYDRIVNRNVIDPVADVERQVLFTALADPKLVEEWNELSKNQPVIFMHTNTTGLNSEINSVTSVAFYKWEPIEVSAENPLTLTKLLDAFDKNKTQVFQRRMTDDEIDGISEQVLRRLDMKGADVSCTKKVYKHYYGATDKLRYHSELDVLEEVSAYLNSNSVVKDVDGIQRTVAPTLVVHDLDGFNIDYLHNKLNANLRAAGPDSSINYYLNNLSSTARTNSCNTYERLASRAGDIYYTDEQLETITDLLHNYIDDINHFANGYRFNDMRSYSSKLQNMIKSLRLKDVAGEITEHEKLLLERYVKYSGETMLDNYNSALKEITNLTINPRGYAFITSDIDDNVVKAALNEAGRTSVNVDARIYVDDVLSYFALDTSDGFMVNVEDLRKMNEMAQYIIKTRDRQIVNGANQFLQSRKSEYDKIIQFCIDAAHGNSWESTQLAYMKDMKVPEDPVETYLMAKKLYNDHLKYWLNDDSVTTLRQRGKDLDAMKYRLNEEAKALGYDDPKYMLHRNELFNEACDYVNNHRRRFKDELVGGGFDELRLEEISNFADTQRQMRDQFWEDYSNSSGALWNDLKEANAEAKEAMLSANKAEWEAKYHPFKSLIEDKFTPAFEAIDEAYKAFNQAKKEKWDFFFNEVKPERERIDKLLDELPKSEVNARKKLKRELNLLNDTWRAYNFDYMSQWFDNLKREIAYEDYVFTDKALAQKYTDTEKQIEFLSKLEGKESEIASLKATLDDLAKNATNYENRRQWLEWHGDFTLGEVKNRLFQEFKDAKNGVLDVDSSILVSNDPEFKKTYKAFVEDGATLEAVRKSTEERYLDYIDSLNVNYEDAKLNSEISYWEAKLNYGDLQLNQLDDFQDMLDNVRVEFEDISSDAFDILEGAHEAEIYNWAAKSDYEKTILRYKNGVLSEGIDLSRRYSEANSVVTSKMRQLDRIDAVYNSYGLGSKHNRLQAAMYTKAKQLFDILETTRLAKRESFQTYINKVTEIRNLQLQQYRYDSLKVDGKFDRTKLLSELVYNNFNMTVFNSHMYTNYEVDDLRRFIKNLQNNGDDFISYYEDKSTGNIFIYLNTNCQVSEHANRRYINQFESFEKPIKNSVPLADFDDIAKVLDLSDIEDFRGVHAHLQSCWEDTRLMSLGAVNGTSGRTVSRKQAEEFLASLPEGMEDYLTSEGLLQFETMRGVVYDPGFARSDSPDVLLDFLETFHHQADTVKDDCALIREVFTKDGDNLQFSELGEHFTDDELVEYFGENPDYVVCTILEGKNTATGFQLRRLNLNNKAGVRAAREMNNTTVIPYDVYYELSNYMNRSVVDNPIKRMLGKYMLVYKAFALLKPGTWVRNYIDATTKASIDTGDGVLVGHAKMLHYESQAIRNLGAYSRLLKADPSLLTKSNWDMIQKTFKTDMAFEDFELLRGVLDGSSRYTTADKRFLNDTIARRGGHNIISGKDLGLRNLDEKSISTAYDKFLSPELQLPLSKSEFLDIYFKRVVPDNDILEQYEEMFRKLSINLHNTEMPTIYDRTVNNMFKPFSKVESIVRYAQTMYLADEGFSSNQILKKIHETQFYNAPVWGPFNKLETIMPFITFKYNNVMFWLRMMDDNPRYFRYFEDIYRNISDDTIEAIEAQGNTIDYEDDYALRSGGISIGSGEIYFNVGNSFLSAVNDFYGLPKAVGDINPLFRDIFRASMYWLGLNSNKFFSDIDLDFSDDDPIQKAIDMVPGGSLARSGYKTFKNIAGKCDENGGPTMDTLFSTLQFLGFIGRRTSYTKDASFSFEEWQDELASQDKWYDCNDGRIKHISEKNEYGANDPNNSFEDTQAYMLVHFGKLWDANQHKFVDFQDYIPGGWNDGFDFENDPEGAWERLKQYMAESGKLYDYNQRKFVLEKDFISGKLNDSNISFERRIELMAEIFPELKWDANQNTFVDAEHYISGGLNDLQGLEGDSFLAHWNELRSLRYALYGEVYDKATKSFVKTGEPGVVLLDSFTDKKLDEKYDRYFSLLGIPRMQKALSEYTISSEGLLMTKDGKYVLIGDAEHDAAVFNKFRNTFTYSGRGRRYNGWKRYSYSKVRKGFNNKQTNKPFKLHHNDPQFYVPQHYLTGFGWNDQEGYYRLAYSYQYQYHNPQPASKLHRLIAPPVFYPYGGGYGKFSFHMR